MFAPNSDCPQNSVFGAIYELNIWGYNSLRVSTLLSVMNLYSVEIKKWENKTHFSMNSDFLVLTQKKKKKKENIFKVGSFL